eukprot:271167_1
MAFVATHECSHCGASQDRRNRANITSQRGAPGQDCLLDVSNGRHNFQLIQDNSYPTSQPHTNRKYNNTISRSRSRSRSRVIHIKIIIIIIVVVVVVYIVHVVIVMDIDIEEIEID